MSANPSWRVGLCSLLLGFFCSCVGPSPVVKSALGEDLNSYQRAVQEYRETGDKVGFDNQSGRTLALAVLRREVLAPTLGLEFALRGSMAPCVGFFEADLVAAQLGTGDTALAAQWLLLNSGLGEVPHSSVKSSASGAPTVQERLRRLAQGNEKERRRAIVGERALRSPAAVPALLEVARLDPSELNRQLAIETLGGVGGTQATLGLVDIWATATPQIQRSILHAWSNLQRAQAGGNAQLVKVAEQQPSENSLAATVLLVRQKQGPAGLAQSVVRAVLATNEPALHLLLLRSEELDIEVLEEAEQLLASPSKLVAALALWRLASAQSLNAEAKTLLTDLLKAEEPEVLYWARRAQARMQVPDSLTAQEKLLVEEMRAAPPAQRRIDAAHELLVSRGVALAVPALADDSPSVRIEVACQILLHNG